MAKEVVTAKTGKDGPETSIQYDFGGDLEGAIKLFGKDAVFKVFRAGGTVALQGAMRGWIGQNKKGAELQALADKWKPAQRKEGKSKAQKVMEDFEKMDPAAKNALLAQLAEKAKAPKPALKTV